MSIFKGAGVALITPFHENGSINYEAFERLIERQIAGGINALIVCGTTGEPATMTEKEHVDCIRFVVETAKHRVPVIAGTGSNCTRAAVDMSKEAEWVGADGLLSVTPYYNKTSQEGLYQHYKAIAHSTSLPIIMYNVPSRTGCNIQPETAARIGHDFENVVGIKEASGNIGQIAKLASLCRGDLDIYSGNDDQIVPILSLGGIGVISVLANVKPKETHDMVMEYLNGNTAHALELQLKYLPLIDALFCDVNPIPVKAALNLLGEEAGALRLPLVPLSEEKQHKLEEMIKNYQ